MLAQLVIENLAVIEQATVDFDGRLNVLTGQTGAGKSLLVGAIEALLGLRASRDMLRAGAAEGRVTGLFLLQDEPARLQAARILGETDAPAEFVVSRRIQESRSIATVNGRPVAANTLRDLAEILIDIHGQHEHQYLLKPSNQLHVLTTYAGANDLADQACLAWQTWRDLQTRADDLARDSQQRTQMLELYRYQAEEIDRVSPTPKEFSDLQAEHRRLANLDRLRQLAAQAAATLGEGDQSTLDQLRQAAAALADMARLDPGAVNLQQACDEALAGLNELAIDLDRYSESLDLDPARLDAAEERIEQIQRLSRKYGQTVDDVLDHRRTIGEQLARLETLETDFGHLDTQIAAARDNYMQLAKRLSQRRHQASDRLAKAVVKELAELGMDKAVCTVELQDTPPGPHGLEAVEFMISANPGLPLRPLRHVASGGELSRIMLALKSVLSADARCSVLVFDEVDANVGGRMGSVIGRKLAALARRNQVLCITHLPQIAAYADRHMTVHKTAGVNTTRTQVNLIADDPDRIAELAEMIAGRNVTDTTRRQAAQLLEEARADSRRTTGRKEPAARPITKAAPRRGKRS
jgi:DNA repair protein RecN (Recombination protein N)